MEAKAIETKKKPNIFVRSDDFIDKPVDVSDGIVSKWIHVETVKKTGDSDEEFVILHTPKCIERYDINKRIHEEAKGTDLKSLIKSVLQTGDETLLNQKQGQYLDITGYPDNTMDAMNNLIRSNNILGELPDELKSKSLEDLINMSAEDIGSFVKDKINEALTAKADKNIEKTKVGEKPVDDTTVKKEGVE